MTEDGGLSGKKMILVSVLGLIVLGALTYAAGLVFNFVPGWYQNYSPIQPIPFSHAIHAGLYKMPCLYCHGAAEYASHAEVPGLETCMNCHQSVRVDARPFIGQLVAAYKENKPIQWVKVHVLPDFVRFNHKRHIAAGVVCETCHGPVQEMDRVTQFAPLNMAWCVNCHRNNNYLQENRIAWSEKTKLLKGLPEPSFLDKVLSHPDPHNADLSCSTCHY
jgi:hypothetical protein